jgi:hypothetical protein
MNGAALHAFFSQMYAVIIDVTVTTLAVHGTQEFCTWEWIITFVSSIDDQAHGMTKGARVALKGVSLQWWKYEGESAVGRSMKVSPLHLEMGLFPARHKGVLLNSRYGRVGFRGGSWRSAGIIALSRLTSCEELTNLDMCGTI